MILKTLIDFHRLFLFYSLLTAAVAAAVPFGSNLVVFQLLSLPYTLTLSLLLTCLARSSVFLFGRTLHPLWMNLKHVYRGIEWKSRNRIV